MPKFLFFWCGRPQEDSRNAQSLIRNQKCVSTFSISQPAREWRVHLPDRANISRRETTRVRRNKGPILTCFTAAAQTALEKSNSTVCFTLDPLSGPIPRGPSTFAVANKPPGCLQSRASRAAILDLAMARRQRGPTGEFQQLTSVEENSLFSGARAAALITGPPRSFARQKPQREPRRFPLQRSPHRALIATGHCCSLTWNYTCRYVPRIAYKKRTHSPIPDITVNFKNDR